MHFPNLPGSSAQALDSFDSFDSKSAIQRDFCGNLLPSLQALLFQYLEAQWYKTEPQIKLALILKYRTGTIGKES